MHTYTLHSNSMCIMRMWRSRVRFRQQTAKTLHLSPLSLSLCLLPSASAACLSVCLSISPKKKRQEKWRKERSHRRPPPRLPSGPSPSPSSSPSPSRCSCFWSLASSLSLDLPPMAAAALKSLSAFLPPPSFTTPKSKIISTSLSLLLLLPCPTDRLVKCCPFLYLFDLVRESRVSKLQDSSFSSDTNHKR